MEAGRSSAPLRPSELLDTARTLTSTSSSAPTDADLRRAVSTAYYAVFHAVLTAGADRLFGAGLRGTPGYTIVYRSFDHGRLKRVCEGIARSVPSPTLQRQIGRASVHVDLRDFARSFVELQDLRHRADYDPGIALVQNDAVAAIDRAERAMASLASAPGDERSDLLALMLGGRG